MEAFGIDGAATTGAAGVGATGVGAVSTAGMLSADAAPLMLLYSASQKGNINEIDVRFMVHRSTIKG